MVSVADISGKTFGFFRSDGTQLARAVKMQANGLIAGSPSSSETSWEIRDGSLFFLDAERKPTTRFWPMLTSQDTLLIFGAFLPMSDILLWHVLWEVRAEPYASSSKMQFDLLGKRFDEMRASVNMIARNREVQTSIKVLFLVHSVETWDCLADIHAAMCRSEDFEPTVATIPRRFPGEQTYRGEDATHRALLDLGVHHLRFGMPDSNEALDIIKALSPDIVFRQSPWEADIPSAFGTHELGFARLCYVPYYGFNLLARFETADMPQPDYYADQALHRMCWRIFCETDATRHLMGRSSVRQAENVVVTGHPKLDRLYAARDRPVWPIDHKRRNFRLIWAPHHSIGTDWLGFGTFIDVYAAMLDWAREDETIDIVLKPHPALLTRIRGDWLDLVPDVELFLTSWKGLTNTSIVMGGDYGPLLAASDAMLTDGISFLAEYQLFDKPLVFLDSGRHSPFNEVGERVMTGAWSVGSVLAARKIFSELRAGVPDALAEKRQAVLNDLLPFPGRSADRVLDEIRSGLSIDSNPAPARRASKPSQVTKRDAIKSHLARRG